MFNQKRPNSVNRKQIDGKENNRNQSNDRGVLNFVGCRPRNSPHFSASIPQELRGALEKSSPWARQSAFSPGPAAFRSLTKSGGTGSRSSDGFDHGSVTRRCRLAQSAKVFVFVFFCGQFFLSIRKLLYAILAGVPGFEPGLSVLETDVLTVDTIPLCDIADFSIFDCEALAVETPIVNRQLAIGNVTWSPCGPCAYGSDGRTSETRDAPLWFFCSL
jgi:hypothetical protein